MVSLGRLYCTGMGFDLLCLFKNNVTNRLQGRKLRTTCIPRRLFSSISKKYCTKTQATRSSQITLFSWVMALLPYLTGRHRNHTAKATQGSCGQCHPSHAR